MIGAFFKSVQQLSDPALRGVVRFGVLGALFAYGLSLAAVWFIIGHLAMFSLGWVGIGAGIAIKLLMLALPMFFFPAISTAIMSNRLEQVVEAVEARHYPDLPPARIAGWAEILRGSLAFLGLMIGVNLLALPVYLLLLLTGLGFLLGLAVNGYLLAREYFDIVALRRLDPDSARILFRSHLIRLWIAGMIIAVLFSIPLVNLLAPVLATSFMLHLFQSLRYQTERV